LHRDADSRKLLCGNRKAISYAELKAIDFPLNIYNCLQEREAMKLVAMETGSTWRHSAFGWNKRNSNVNFVRIL